MNKFQNCALTPRREILIMGDSNLAKLPPILNKKVQIDWYPGAKLTHATHIIKNKTPTEPKVTKVILSFGINDREIADLNMQKKNLGTLMEWAQQTFPNAVIYIPISNFSKTLPLQIQKNITQLNTTIEEWYDFIPQLDESKFETMNDRIHWTPATASNIWKHWEDFLGLSRTPTMESGPK